MKLIQLLFAVVFLLIKFILNLVIGLVVILVKGLINLFSGSEGMVRNVVSDIKNKSASAYEDLKAKAEQN